MKLNTVIFDMDGLLIDSEPLWQQAGAAALAQQGVVLTDEQYHSSTGLRTPEWVEYWFGHFSLDFSRKNEAIEQIEENALQLIVKEGVVLPGVDYIFEFFRTRGFRIGLASSSPRRFIDAVVDKLNIGPALDSRVSAEGLPFGKPHPQVFIDCATLLGATPAQCLVFEDSFNGLIAAKAAKMKCVVIPPPAASQAPKWVVADHMLGSLQEFNQQLLQQLG